jgi:hypothetical protein
MFGAPAGASQTARACMAAACELAARAALHSLQPLGTAVGLQRQVPDERSSACLGGRKAAGALCQAMVARWSSERAVNCNGSSRFAND